MRIEVIKNFLSPCEVALLNSWAIEGVEKSWLDVGLSASGTKIATRLNSRFYGDRFEYPEIVINLSNRIRNFVGVEKYPIISKHGRDGVVVSYTLPGGDVFEHMDNRSVDGVATLRCNVLTQKADAGGQLHVCGEILDIDVGDLHCYLVSEHRHGVTKVEGNTPRIMWMFGAHVPTEDWNSGKIKVNNGVS
jgi:hypothetical protein